MDALLWILIYAASFVWALNLFWVDMPRWLRIVCWVWVILLMLWAIWLSLE
jgi:hypothetical protein